MQNKSFFYKLRLTVPEHQHSRRNRYVRKVREGFPLWYHLMAGAVLVLAASLPVREM